MKIANYLLTAKVDELPIDYKWSVSIGNKFHGVTNDDNPKLGKALGQINEKASYGLVIACVEWVVARLSRHLDVSDALLRVEASWAAMIDPRYAQLSAPDAPDVDERFVLTGPLWSSLTMMCDSFEESIQTSDGTGLFDSSISLVLLGQHVVGRSPLFKTWLPDTLQRLQQISPNRHQPLPNQAPVLRETFDPAGYVAGSEDALRDAFLATLDPDRNPYLRPVDELNALGMTTPYPGKP
ncbi:hypothetical protein [Pseudomonas sp. RW409]|uniref:hypothetical protein n=1 Tax=Pseudomonas sp. RW409 TaxID=2202895 RepID=UPI000D72B065|nr:hypothetical protein [Pseudomonas sp. RW409]PWY36407.1 hypothetical protein DK261_28290 [Pseudomonas sp. RW409]